MRMLCEGWSRHAAMSQVSWTAAWWHTSRSATGVLPRTSHRPRAGGSSSSAGLRLLQPRAITLPPEPADRSPPAPTCCPTAQWQGPSPCFALGFWGRRAELLMGASLSMNPVSYLPPAAHFFSLLQAVSEHEWEEPCKGCCPSLYCVKLPPSEIFCNYRLLVPSEGNHIHHSSEGTFWPNPH